MASDKKSVRIAKNLAQELRLRQSALAVTEGFGTAGDPTVLLGLGTTTNPSVFFRVVPLTWSSALTTLGSAAEVYNPHVVQFVYEEHANTMGEPQYLVLGYCLAALTGCKVEVYTVASGQPTNEAGITGTPVEFWPSIQQTLRSAQ